jgi:hypothetical protein
MSLQSVCTFLGHRVERCWVGVTAVSLELAVKWLVNLYNDREVLC